MASPVILWFRRDLRLGDHPALTAAVQNDAPVIPVFIRDPLVDGLGASPKWRLGLGLKTFARTLEQKGSRLVLRSGPALDALQELIRETGAKAVYWTRLYDPDSMARDAAIKAALKDCGVAARSFGGHLLFEPWTVQTKVGGYFRVYSPMWRAVQNRPVDTPLPKPTKLPTPENWPTSEPVEDWALGAAMNRGGAVVADHANVGEEAAHGRLLRFIDTRLDHYEDRRDLPAGDGTSDLSENLSLGEISPNTCWHAAMPAMDRGVPSAEKYVKELAWREFAYHLMYHTPHILSSNWRREWDAFPWNTNEDHPHVTAWKQGRTGVPFVDAAMREMYVTGRMHNRARMIVASYLTKHLMCHWQIGLRWFEDCLIDWDPASNAMGWQWAAGSGPDAAPYFRVFNPETQLQKFDASGEYVRRWIAEDQASPSDTAMSYFDAVPQAWGLRHDTPYPQAIVSMEAGRKAALHAYESRSFRSETKA